MRKLILFFIVFSAGCMFRAYTQNQPNLYKKADADRMTQWVDSVFDKLTLDERIGQLFMIVADPGTGDFNTKKIIKNIKEQHIGGILFSKGTVSEQAKSTNMYQKESKVPLLISLDGEWGLSMRLENTPRFPKNILLGAIQDNTLLYKYGEEVARECKEMGIHINFAPVLDINTNPNNPVIGTRSFGEVPRWVADKGEAYAMGLESEGVISVAKHFPGHGDTSEDSHETLPTVGKSLMDIQNEDLIPFSRYINLGFAGIMTGHLNIPSLDSETGKPTSLSAKIVTELLQDSMNFHGLTFTDALVMKGAGSGSICVDALLAGNDILLSPGNPVAEFNAVKRAVERGVISISSIEERCLKVLAYKYIVGLNNYKPVELQGLQSRINSEYAEWLIKKLNAAGMTLLKNEDDLLPVKELDKKRIAVISVGEGSRTGFQEVLSLYDRVGLFNIARGAGASAIEKVFRDASAYDLIVCGIHSDRIADFVDLQKLAREKDVILCYFISPYSLIKYKNSIQQAKAVILGYENLRGPQEAAAQIIMGGLPAQGRLPVTIHGLFESGAGIETEKVRLSYLTPIEVGLSGTILKNIDSIVNDGLKNKAFPGCQVLVAKDGVVVYNKSYGYFDYANTHPVQISDVYDLASVTKAAATVPAVMKVYDEDKIMLIEKMSNYIPELKGTNKDNITVEDALFHESGLPSFVPFYRSAIDNKSYNGSLISNKRTATHRIEYDLNTFARTDFKYKKEFVSTTRSDQYPLQVARNFYLSNSFKDVVMKDIVNAKLRANKSYLYSDLNFMLLKEMVENVSDEPFDDFLEKNFYDRLGAGLTRFNPLRTIDTLQIAPTENDRFLRNQILIGFVHDEAAAFMGGVSGNAGLFSNANDLAKLLQMLLNQGEYGGERYLSEETVRIFTETKSPNSRRGLGFDKPEVDDDSEPIKGVSAATYGHTGYTGTCFWVDPQKQLIYIFLSNRVYPSRTNRSLMRMDIRSRIQNVIYEAIM